MRRGQTLLEGLIAAVILAIGITGVLQAVLLSSTQNAGAGRITEAAAISNQVANGLLRYDIRQLKEAGLLDGTRCSADATIISYAGGLETQTLITGGNTRCASGNCSSSDITTTTPCVVDLDEYEQDTGVADNRKLVSGYNFAARYQAGQPGGYKRVAVVFNNETASRTIQVTTVTSFVEAGRRRFLRRSVSMAQPLGYAGF